MGEVELSNSHETKAFLVVEAVGPDNTSPADSFASIPPVGLAKHVLVRFFASLAVYSWSQVTARTSGF